MLLRQIAEIVAAPWLPLFDDKRQVTHLQLDSRQLTYPESSLFFALRGERFDGHRFLSAAYQAGVRAFVVEHHPEPPLPPDAALLVVKDAREALQRLAAHKRKEFKAPVVGITGSNGKTVVKEWLYSLLAPDMQVVRSPGSYNSQVGVPLSVWLMEESHDLALIEAGISKSGEMQRLAQIIRPTLGIFTHLGDAHSEGFTSLENKLEEKLSLFATADCIVYHREQRIVDDNIRRLFPDKELRGWAYADEFAENTTLGEFIHQHLPFQDAAATENAGNAIVLLRYLGYSPAVIASRLPSLEAIALRMEQKAGINGCTLIDDSYSNDLQSLAIALAFLSRQSTNPNLTVILSDIVGSQLSPTQLYMEVAELLKSRKITRLIGIGKAIGGLAPLLPPSIAQAYYTDTAAFIQNFQPSDFIQENILIKGARHFALERVSELLALKSHRTTLSIHLNALAHNLAVFRNLLHPETKIMVMVKAAAYGSGGDEIARMLSYAKADYLAVAYADEGVSLRKAGVKLPIMVMSADETQFDTLLRFNLEPEIYTIHLLERWVAFVGAKNASPANVHLKLESGMNRLGFDTSDLPALCAQLQVWGIAKVCVRSLLSHLAVGDEPDEAAFTHHQARRFAAAATTICQAIGYRPLHHLLNSAAIASYPEYQGDMVRLGIGLYGIGDTRLGLLPVHSLKTVVLQIKTIPEGESIGYGRSQRTDAPTRIATLAIGYADGFFRRLSNGKGSVILRGEVAPVIGRVCMDMCMVNISHIPKVQVGDQAEIFGIQQSLHDFAAAAETIPYEVLTSISPRVQRVYWQD